MRNGFQRLRKDRPEGDHPAETVDVGRLLGVGDKGTWVAKKVDELDAWPTDYCRGIG